MIPVLFPQQDLDGVEVGSLTGLFTPAALHQDSKLLTVTVEADGGTEERDTTLTQSLNNLCRGSDIIIQLNVNTFQVHINQYPFVLHMMYETKMTTVHWSTPVIHPSTACIHPPLML